MSRDALRWTLAKWFSAALVLRVVLALPLAQPGYMDAAYYFDGARTLAAGHGLVEEHIWNYLAHPRALPQPSNAYWMPLTSLLLAPFVWLLGDSFRVAQLPMVALAALLPPATYALSWHLFGRRDWATHAALLMLFSSFYLPLWGTTDSFALYALIGSAIVALLARVAAPTDTFRYAAAAGVAIALAHLTRADGVLWLAPAVVVCLRRAGAGRALAALAVGYGALMLPWFLRNIGAFGSPLVGSALFARTYDDLFVYDQTLTFGYWLDGGVALIAGNIVRALGLNLGTIAGSLFVLYLPFALIGACVMRAHAIVSIGIAYLALLYLALSIFFAPIGWRGTMLHSLTAVLPLLYALAPVGLSASLVFVASRRSAWLLPTAERVFGIAFLLVALLVSAWFYSAQFFGGERTLPWNRRDETYRVIADYLARNGNASTPVMCINPPQYHLQSGSRSIAIPTDGVDAVLHAARQFGASYLVLEPDHPQALAFLYADPARDPRFVPIRDFRDASGAIVWLLEIR